MSICNDALRPIYGPSSSHTYAPARLAYGVHECLKKNDIEKDINVNIYFMGGSEDSFKGHSTDKAIITALLGFSPYEEEFEKIRSLNVEIDKKRRRVFVKGYNSMSFKFFINEKYKVREAAFAIKIHVYSEEMEMELVGLSCGGGDIKIKPEKLWSKPKKLSSSFEIRQPGFYISDKNIKKLQSSKYNVRSLKELASLAESEGKKISDIAIEREKILTNKTSEKLLEYMQENWKTMKKGIEEGLSGKLSGELTQDIALKMQTLFNLNKVPFDYIKPYSYAIAVSLVNASIGRVVSCPTGGSAGIVPGVAYNLYKEGVASDDDIVNSLFTAGIICLIIKSKASVSGAQHGCQAECGVARAMAAALETEILGGAPSQVINAVGYAIEGSLGLICDPIGGLVEIPCIIRNGMYAIAAIGDVGIALSDINLAPLPDEIIAVLDEVGRDMNAKYKETGKGGLAATKSGKKEVENLKNKSKRYLIPYDPCKVTLK